MDVLEIVWWHWLALASLLLIAEAFGAGGFLLGFVAAALTTAILEAAFGLGWQWQLLCFSGVGTLLSYFYVLKFKRFNQATDKPELNNRLAGLVGRQARVVQQLGSDEYKVQIGDTLWRATSSSFLAEGAFVEVTSVKNDELVVSANQD